MSIKRSEKFNSRRFIMCKKAVVLTIVLVVSILSTSAIGTPPPSYIKVWEDTFDGTSLDGNNWSLGCKDDVSGNKIPGAAGTYLLNDGYDSYQTAEDVWVSGGNLYLQNQKRTYVGDDPAGTYEYTTGWINSMHKVYFNKGYVEFRAQFPSGDKVWPALWLIAEDLRWGPEWDMWEYFGYRSDYGYDTMHNHLLTGRTNWYGDAIDLYDQTYDCESWHVYGFEWHEDYAKWYIDGVPGTQINSADVRRYPNEDMYFVLNNSTRTDSPDTNTTWPNYVVIDYVELYEPGTGPDIYPPYPDPAFSLGPHPIGNDSLQMSAEIPGDENPPIDYYFACTAGGGHDSGWQTSNTYVDSGLQPNTQYTYTVNTRDSLGNTGTPSSPASGTTNDASALTVQNYSFEYVDGQPILEKQMGVTPDYWAFVNANWDGVEWPSSEGEVSAAVVGNNSIYQTLDHTIAEGDAYTLKFDAYYLWSDSTWDCTFQGALYYEDGGSRVVIDYVEDRFSAGMPDETWHLDYTVNTTITAGHPAIGKALGVEFFAVDQLGYSFGFDNVRVSLAQSVCGDGTCDPGEDQCNCPDDCGTPPSTETSCTDGVDNDCDNYTDCDDSDCLGDPACPTCGDETCDPGEDQCNCPDDCGTPPSTETSCTDGVDNDCDTYTDCDDSDCDGDPACPDCLPKGAACTDNAECCSGNCLPAGRCK